MIAVGYEADDDGDDDDNGCLDQYYMLLVLLLLVLLLLLLLLPLLLLLLHAETLHELAAVTHADDVQRIFHDDVRREHTV